MFKKNCFRNIMFPSEQTEKGLQLLNVFPCIEDIMVLVVANTNEMLVKDNVLVMIECQLIWSKLVLAWVSIVVWTFHVFIFSRTIKWVYNFNYTLCTAFFSKKGSSGQCSTSRGDNNKIEKNNWQQFKLFFSMTIGIISYKYCSKYAWLMRNQLCSIIAK